jgi:hypothetical protein
MMCTAAQSGFIKTRDTEKFRRFKISNSEKFSRNRFSRHFQNSSFPEFRIFRDFLETARAPFFCTSDVYYIMYLTYLRVRCMVNTYRERFDKALQVSI